jgi:hypothetical protein
MSKPSAFVNTSAVGKQTSACNALHPSRSSGRSLHDLDGNPNHLGGRRPRDQDGAPLAREVSVLPIASNPPLMRPTDHAEIPLIRLESNPKVRGEQL